MKNPKKLFERPIECCHVDSQNKQVLNFDLFLFKIIYFEFEQMEGFMLIMTDFVQVLEQHLVCAAHEHPLSVNYDEQYFGPCLESVIISLKARGYLSSVLSSDSSRIWNYIGPEVYVILKKK